MAAIFLESAAVAKSTEKLSTIPIVVLTPGSLLSLLCEIYGIQCVQGDVIKTAIRGTKLYLFTTFQLNSVLRLETSAF